MLFSLTYIFYFVFYLLFFIYFFFVFDHYILTRSRHNIGHRPIDHFFSSHTIHTKLEQLLSAPNIHECSPTLSLTEDEVLQPTTLLEANRDLKKVGRSIADIAKDFQNSPLFVRKTDLIEVSATEMADFYEAAIEAKMGHEDIQTCELLVYEMLNLCLVPTSYSTKLIMGYYFRKEKYNDVLRMFENIPKWGGKRTFVHGSMVIAALTNVGRLSDAWRGAEIMEKDGRFLTHEAVR